jgi:nickel-dependent lactate racemase
MTESEINDRYGKEIAERVSIINHEYENEDALVNMGKTALGTPISVNKKVCEADFVIGVGNIVPHCYAGWAGGGKIIQPGVCGEKTTEMTHLLAAQLIRKEWIAGNLNNDVRQEIDAVALKAGLKLIINTVLNQEDEISYLAIGSPIEAFKEGVKTAEKMYCQKVPGYADIVIVSSYPADIDYWQAEKALSYAMMGVKPGGTVIFITPCPERISPVHGKLFEERAKLSYEENLKAIKRKEIEDVIGGAGLLIHSHLMEHAEVICYSNGLRDKDKEALGFKQADSIEEAVEMALKNQGKKAKIGVLACGDIIPLVE